MKKPDWNSMTLDEAIALLKSIRNDLCCEDAEDAVLSISEKLGVDQRVDADNEWDDDDEDDDWDDEEE
jgi:hypothetical protein